MEATLTPGQRAARLRKVRGLTQQQLADAVGISRVYVNNIEHDQAPNVRPLILDAIAAELGFPNWALLAASRSLEQAGLTEPSDGELHRLRQEVRALKRALGLTQVNSQNGAMAAPAFFERILSLA